MQFTKKSLFYIANKNFISFWKKIIFLFLFFFYFEQPDYPIFAMLTICFAIKFHFDLNFFLKKHFECTHPENK